MKTKLLSYLTCIAVFLILINLSSNAQESAKGKIEIKEIPAQTALIIKAEVETSSIGQKMGELYSTLFTFTGQNNIQPAGNAFAVYYSFDPKGLTKFESGVPVLGQVEGNGEIELKEYPAMKVVSLLYVGPYEKMETPYMEIEKYVKDNGLKTAGIAWEVYLNGPGMESDPNKYQTIIYYVLE